MQDITRIRALCCVCGNLRTASARWARRFEPADCGRSLDDGGDPRGWRMTRTLKCSVCKVPTVHALLRDDRPDVRDMAEKRECEQMQADAVCRIKSIMTAISPDDLTLRECHELLAVLRPMADRRRGVL